MGTRSKASAAFVGALLLLGCNQSNVATTTPDWVVIGTTSDSFPSVVSIDKSSITRNNGIIHYNMRTKILDDSRLPEDSKWDYNDKTIEIECSTTHNRTLKWSFHKLDGKVEEIKGLMVSGIWEHKIVLSEDMMSYKYVCSVPE